MMRTWHLYDLTSGLFDGRRFSSSDPTAIDGNRHGMGAIEGVIDPESQRVDISTGAIIDYQPPAPDATHVWIENDPNGRRVRRWILSPAFAERRRRISAILGELAALDARMIRPLGELYSRSLSIDDDAMFEAQATLDDINKQKAALRAELRDLKY